MSMIEGMRLRYAALGRRKIPIPEWGGDTYCKPYTMGDRRRMEAAMERGKDEGVVTLVICKLENEDGSQAFDRANVTEAMKIGEAGVMERVVSAIIADYPSTLEDAEKN